MEVVCLEVVEEEEMVDVLFWKVVLAVVLVVEAVLYIIL
jgi:hypothetical protein